MVWGIETMEEGGEMRFRRYLPINELGQIPLPNAGFRFVARCLPEK